MAVELVMTVLVTVVLAATGVSKVLAVPAMRERAAHLGYTAGSFRLVGALELAGVAGLWVGRVASEPLVVAAGVALLVLMGGAVVSHLRAGDGPTASLSAAVVSGLLLGVLAGGIDA